MSPNVILQQEVYIELNKVGLQGDLFVPPEASSLIIFAHGSGSGRKSFRNRAIANFLNNHGFGSLLFDLLTTEEEEQDEKSGDYRFDVDLLSQRLLGSTQWIKGQPFLKNLYLGYFGSSTGTSAALVASVKAGGNLQAIVSRGGRPDLSPSALPFITVPTLFIVGGNDEHVLELNRQAYDMLPCKKRLEVVAGAGHLFEEPGKLDQVSQLTMEWFKAHLGKDRDYSGKFKVPESNDV